MLCILAWHIVVFSTKDLGGVVRLCASPDSKRGVVLMVHNCRSHRK